jgi:hypothetical protein
MTIYRQPMLVTSALMDKSRLQGRRAAVKSKCGDEYECRRYSRGGAVGRDLDICCRMPQHVEFEQQFVEVTQAQLKREIPVSVPLMALRRACHATVPAMRQRSGALKTTISNNGRKERSSTYSSRQCVSQLAARVNLATVCGSYAQRRTFDFPAWSKGTA